MSAATFGAEASHVVLIDGRLYGLGDTRQKAIADFRAQTAGATPAMRTGMAARARVVPVTDDHASDVAEMRDAEAVAWLIGTSQSGPDADQDDGDRRFLNFYDCPCGTMWSNEDDCTCDDRCPECRTACSPTRSDDA